MPKQPLDQIPLAAPDARRIAGLVKGGGRIAGVAIAHRGDTEYLKSIPDGSENNNLDNLPSVSPQA